MSLILSLIFSVTVSAQLVTKKFVFNEKNPVQIYNFDKYDKVPGKYPQSALYKIKKAYLNNRAETCLSLIIKHQKKMPGLLPWVYNQQMLCGLKLNFKFIKNKNTLVRIFQRAKSSPVWFVGSPYSKSLTENYIQVGLRVLSNQLKGDRSKAWKTFSDVEAYVKFMQDKDRAWLYKMAGELAFIQQRIVLAKNFFLRSLDYRDSRTVREKLKAIDVNFNADKNTDRKDADSDLTISDEEKKILTRLKRSLDQDDVVAITEDAVQIIQKYPASKNAEWANNIIRRLYYRLAGRSDPKLALLKSKVRELVEVIGGDRLLQWGKKFYSRGLYADSFWFSDRAYKKLLGQEESIKALRLSALSLYAVGNYKGALDRFQQVTIMASGTKKMVSSLFYIGTLNFRLKKYSESASAFEKLIALPETFNYELSSRYWLWRAKQKIIGGLQKEYAQKIYEKYPMTYYGLRAYGETHNKELKWIDLVPLRKTVDIKMTNREALAYQRFNVLSASGWSKESQAELSELMTPKLIDEKLVFAKLWTQAAGYSKAMRLTGDVFDEDLSYIKWNVIKNIYPVAYKELVKKYSIKNGLQPFWVISLMRQESSFNPTAISSSNARGLMQLVRITANEVAGKIKVKGYRFPESLHEPSINIRMGSNYLKRMLRANNGYFPLALACYNAGIGNIRKWMRSRRDLTNLKNTTTSDPESELWVDELPWSETRFYVKSIMRNYLIYNLLEKGNVKLKDPLWDL